MLRLRHTVWLARDLVGFTRANRVWWLLPLTVVIVIMAFALTAANAALPYAVYTLF